MWATVNTMWNSLHPIINGVFDMHLEASTLTNPTYAKIYQFGTFNKTGLAFTAKRYFGSVLHGIWNSLVIFWGAFLIIHDSEHDLVTFGHVTFTSMIICHWIYGLLDIKHFTKIHFLGIFITICLYIIFQNILIHGWDYVSVVATFPVAYGSARIFGQGEFWLVVCLIVVASVLPYWFFEVLRYQSSEEMRGILEARRDQKKQKGHKRGAGFGACFRGGKS